MTRTWSSEFSKNAARHLMTRRIFSRLIRHPIRNLLDHSGAVVAVQSQGAPTRIVGFDIAPRIVRALRLAAHTVNGRNLVSKLHAEGPLVIHEDRLRAFPLGPRLRPLASGHLVLHGHVELGHASHSIFVFTGVRKGSPDRLEGELLKLADKVIVLEAGRLRSVLPEELDEIMCGDAERRCMSRNPMMGTNRQ